MTKSQAVSNARIDGKGPSAPGKLAQDWRPGLSYRALEPRMAFDAAMAATAEHAGDTAPAASNAVEAHNVTSEPLSTGAVQDLASALLSTAETMPGSPRPGEGRSVVVFIDGQVSNPGLIAGAVPDDAEIVILDPAADGVSQIAHYLDGRTGIDAVHIVSHGSEGQLNLGSSHLTLASLAGEHADEMAAISSALSAEADILLYGCDVAEGESGAQFVAALADATGADVAASSDDTGAAALGGDWDLETRTGLIEAGLIDAPEWNGLLAPLTISVTGAPTVTGTGAVGTTAVCFNAGFIGGTAIDLRATVTSLTTLGGLPFFGTSGDDAFFQLTQQGSATLRWEIFAHDPVNPLTVYAVGTPEFRIADVDGVGGVFHTRESVAPSLDHLSSYTLSSPTNLQVSVSAGAVEASGTADQNGESTSLVGFVWNNVSSWDVTYTLHLNQAGVQARFLHDGDGDFTFVAPNTVSMLSIDLDANNSTAAGTGYQTTYTENGAGVPVVDGDAAIAQHVALGTNLGSATITLTNTQAGDQLLVGGSPAASGTVNGLSYTISTSGSATTVTLTGSASVATYQTALQAITFASTSESPGTVDRQIEVSVTNTTYATTSNTALSTIHVTPVNDAPVDGNETNSVIEDTTLTVANGATGDLLTNASDVDGDTLTITGYTIAGMAGTQTVGAAVTVTSGATTAGTLTLNSNGSYSFVPAINYTGAIPVITYTVSDGNGGTDTSTLTLSMVAVNDAPVDGNETNSVTEDTTLTVADGATGDLLNNATDADGDMLTITGYSIVGMAGMQTVGSAVTVTSGATTAGTLTLTADGSYSFVPAANYAGAIPLVTYTVSDGNGGTDTSTLQLIMVAVNDAPVSTDDSVTTAEDTPKVLALTEFGTYSDAEGTAIASVKITSLETDGSLEYFNGTSWVAVTLNHVVTAADITAGSLRFSPDLNENGSPYATVGFQVSDGTAFSAASNTLTVHVTPVNDVPSGTPANQTSADGNTVAIDAGSAFTDADGDDIDYTIAGLPAGLTFDPETGIISGTLGSNASQGGTGGVYTITVGASDGTATTTRTFTLTVSNPAPVAIADTATTNENASQTTGDVTPGTPGQDHDGGLDSDALSVTAGQNASGGALPIGSEVTLPSGAKLTLNADGTYTYKPNGAFEGLDSDEIATDSFSYTIADGQGGTSTATVTVTIDGRNDVPQAGTLPNIAGQDGGTVSLALGAFVTDPDSEPLTFTISGLPAGLTYNPSTGLVTGQIDYSASQNGLFAAPGGGTIYLIALSVSDGDAEITRTFQYTVTNPAPDAKDDVIAASEDGPAATGSVLANNGTGTDVDGATDGDTLTVSAVNGSAVSVGQPIAASNGGLVTIDANGTFNFSPAGDFEDLDAGETRTTSVTYTISDGQGGTDTATVTFMVTGANDAPVATDNSNSLGEDAIAPATGNIVTDDGGFGADSDPDAEPVSVAEVNGTAVSGPTNIAGLYGTLTINPDGSYSYALNNALAAVQALGDGATLTEMFAYTLTDGDLTDLANLTITITGSNDAPVAVDDTLGASEDGPDATGNVISGPGTDTDAENDTLSVTEVNGVPSNVGASVAGSHGGLFTIGSGGTLSFDPDGGFEDLALGETRTSSIAYTVSDGNGGTGTATVTVTVTGTNDAPIVIDPATGLPAGDPNAAVPQQSGTDSAAITPLDVTTYFTDADASDTLTLSVDPAGLPPGITFDPLTGTFSGTPDHSASQGGPNSDGLYPVVVTATDPNGATVTTTVVFALSNPAPVAADDGLAGSENQTLTGSVYAGNGQGIDSDPDGDAFSVSAVGGLGANAGQPVAGSNGGSFIIEADGDYTFTPGANFDDLAQGETRTTTVTYTISDGEGGTDSATVTVTVTGTNDGPIVVDPSTGLPALDPNAAISAQSSNDGEAITPLDVSDVFADADATDLLAFSASGLPAGLAIDPGTGIISGTVAPGASVSGPYTVTVTATDPYGATVTSTFTWNVANPAPVAENDAFTGSEDGPVVAGNVFADNGAGIDHDTAPDSDPITVSEVNGVAGDVGQPVAGTSGGTFTIGATGGLTFDPAGDFEDLAQGETRTTFIAYTISDGQGGTDSATVTVTVTGTNDAPIVIDPATGLPALDPNAAISAQSSNDGEAITALDVADVFADADTTDGLEFSASGLPAGLAIDPVTGVISGIIAFDASVSGPYTATVTATDPHGAAVTSTFTWNVANPAPVAAGDSFTGSEDGPAVTGNVLSDNGAGGDHDTAPDSDPLTVSEIDGVAGNIGQPVAGSNGGSFTVSSDGTFAFDPAGDFDDLAQGETRTTSIVYTISDGQGGTDTATATVTVTGVNDQPVALDDAGGVGEDGPALAVPAGSGVLTNDTDPDTSDVLTVSAVNGVAGDVGQSVAGANGGSFQLAADGSYSFDPGASFQDLAQGETRTTSITYTVDDGHGGSATAPLEITVMGANDTPLIADPATGLPPADPNAIIPAQNASDSGTITPLDVRGFFTDTDTSDVLTLAVDPAALPAGITFDPATGTFTGTIDHQASQGGPNSDGVYPVVITATDPYGATVTTAVVFTVINPPPVAADDMLSTAENTPASGSVFAGNGAGPDADPDGDTIMVSEVNGVAGDVGQPVSGSNGGTFTLSTSGDFSFDPGTDFDGLAAGETRTTSLTYSIDDGNGGTDTATVSITVNGVNDTPFVVDPATGLPPADPNAIVPAQAADDGAAIAPLDVTGYFDDLDQSDALTFAVDPATLPAGIVFDPLTGTFSGTPVHDASQGSSPGQPAGTYVIPVTATDPHGAAATTLVVFHITNPPPLAGPDQDTASEDGPGLTGQALANDADGGTDTDALSVAAVNGDAGLVGIPVAGTTGGSFTLGADGGWSFDPGNDFQDLAPGETRDTVITYSVSDGNGGSADATITVTVTGTNDAPVVLAPVPPQPGADGAPITTFEVRSNFGDVDQTGPLALSVDAAQLPPGIAFDPVTGTFSGTPAAYASQGATPGDPAGTYVVIVTATDASGATVTTTVHFSFVNLAPVATDDTASAGEDTADVSGNVITGPGTDSDTGPDSDPLSVISADQNGTPITIGTPHTTAGGGVLTLNADGSYMFEPGTAYNGLDVGETESETITYTVSDGNGGTAVATLVVTINGANDGPAVIDPANPGTADNPTPATDPLNIIADVSATDGATPAPVNVGDYIVDPDGEPLTFTATGLPPGMAIDPATGIISGTLPANASQTGPYTVTVTATDPDGASVQTTVTYTVGNLPPVAVEDQGTTRENTAVTINVLANDRDTAPDSDPLSVIAATAKHGSIVINADGTLTYRPGSGFSGAEIITYVISDGNGGTATATVRIWVRADALAKPMPESPDGVHFAVLEPQPDDLQVDGMVLDAVASTLPSANELPGGTVPGWSWQPAGYDIAGYDLAGLSSFSLNLSSSTQKGETGIETFVRNRVLIVTLKFNDGATAWDEIEWKVQRADGRPLPEWLSMVGEDVLTGERPADVDVIDLRITGLTSDGRTIVNEVRIRAATGEVEPLSLGRQGSIAPPLLWDQIRVQRAATDGQIRALAEHLRNAG